MSEEEQADAAEAADAGASDETEQDTDADTEAAGDGIAEGDFVELEYTVRTITEDDEEGRVVDTTSQEVAEEAGIDDDEHDFSPRTVTVGEGHVFESVDDDLVGREVGDGNEVTVPAAEAFGEFDPDQVKTVTANKIPEDDRYPGAQVTVDGDQGYLETIVGGRARVDFNHPLAGDDLTYDYEIVGRVDDEEEQAAAMIGMYLQEEPDVRIEEDVVEEEVTVDGEEDDEEPETETVERDRRSLVIEATPMMQMNQQWMFSKQQIAQQLIDELNLDRVVVEEVIDGGAGGMPGMMGGMGGGGAGLEEAVEEAAEDEDIDVDADELVEELDEE
ncbi:peptidylprolyl isomerase [Halobaculum sp. MBLA0147]|uniref:FKBP-type peptidyl-prolyl cis-trans isomerase n=1 Tax=Halobaculum sp. MBLA0147 TaxID=3079934 RepID=UPI0035240A39